MAVGLPLKTTYADGDVYAASDVNDTNGTINITAAPFAAGKNKIINGDFYVNQRAFSSSTTSGTYGFDRWTGDHSGGTVTWSAQTFTAGAAPVAGYEGKNYLRAVISGQSGTGNYAAAVQKIESVRTCAGQTVTVSFWAKADAGTPKVSAELRQQFGSGGSADVTATPAQNSTISTSWARYTQTFAVPSISGKTIGAGDSLSLIFFVSAGSDLNSRTNSSGLNNTTIELWGFQVEVGSTATAFQTATGTIQGELAACQRYYYRTTPGLDTVFGIGMPYTTAISLISIALPVPMRIRPTALEQTGTAANYKTLRGNAAAYDNLTSVPTYNAGTTSTLGFIQTGSANLVAGNAVFLFSNDAAAYLGWSAEL
jgi:hypothetical protein